MIREIVAANLVKLRDIKYASIPTVTRRNEELAKEIGTTLSQIQRIVKKELGTSVDTLESLAHVFGCSPADIVTPYYATRTTTPAQMAQSAPLQMGSLQRS